METRRWPNGYLFLGFEFGKTGGHLDHFFDLRRVIVEMPRQALGDFVNGQVIEDQVDFFRSKSGARRPSLCMEGE